ncbi:DUF5626 family protein [Cytobacillus firmus]|nr:DUF5626 family protein [Cytobacillus firmus]
MNFLKILGLSILMISLFSIGSGPSKASAAEELSVPSTISDDTKTVELDFNLFTDDKQQTTFINDNGEEITITVERVPESQTKTSNTDIIAYGSTHYLPYGTTKYKVSASSPVIGMSFYVDVNVPSTNINNSKILKAYDKSHWVIGGYLYDHNLTKSDKSAKYDANVTWLGGLGGASCYVKASLSGNVITTTASL